MSIKTVSLLGSTGSIGRQSLDVIDHLGDVRVVSLSANDNAALLAEQCRKYKPLLAVTYNKERYSELKSSLADTDIKVMCGMDGLLEAAAMPQADAMLNAVQGSIGLIPTIEAIKAKKRILLANKEPLVSAGALIIRLAMEHGVDIFPIDSEHSAVFQCLSGGMQIKQIWLTASGGAFRGKKRSELAKLPASEALKHPTWKMGKKITIDCATMMNKGFEVIEAKWLFGLTAEQIKVVVHPQSIIHSMVEYVDGSVIAQLSQTDMRLPIQYALTYPERRASLVESLDFTKIKSLDFETPDYDNFPCLNLAYKALERSGTVPAVMNEANEKAVKLYMDGQITFYDIPRLIETAMDTYTYSHGLDYTLDDVTKAEEYARKVIAENLCQ
jgi:1-deoxy-D-xylulose-5-phosphate reductoisomerase